MIDAGVNIFSLGCPVIQLNNIAATVFKTIFFKITFNFVKGEKLVPELHLLVVLFWTNLKSNININAPKKYHI